MLLLDIALLSVGLWVCVILVGAVLVTTGVFLEKKFFGKDLG
jgi:uncharacterized membrane protein